MPGEYGYGFYGSGFYGSPLGAFADDDDPATPESGWDPAGSLAQRLYQQLAPLAYADEQHDFALRKLCEALIGRGQQIEDLARDTDERPGWARLVDPDEAPIYALGFLAQLVGVRLRPGLEETEQRERIKSTDGKKRGSVEALKAAPLPYLTGTRTVFLNERQGSAYVLGIATWDAETASADQVEAALREQKPAGIILNYSTIEGGDFATLRDTHTDFADVEATFTDFADVRSDPSQQ